MTPWKVAEPKDSGDDVDISLAEVTEVVKKFLSGKMLHVDKSCPEMLKAWMLLASMPIQHPPETKKSTHRVVDQGGVSYF